MDLTILFVINFFSNNECRYSFYLKIRHETGHTIIIFLKAFRVNYNILTGLQIDMRHPSIFWMKIQTYQLILNISKIAHINCKVMQLNRVIYLVNLKTKHTSFK